MKTKRLILKELTSKDAKALFYLFSDPDTMHFTDTEPIQKLEEAIEEIDFISDLKKKKQGIRWGVFRKEDRRLIGTCGYHRWDKQAGKAEIGYEIGSPFWRKGYMSEAFSEMINFGFEFMALHRIEALVFKENEKSIRLLKKFGFREEKCLEKTVFCKGTYWEERCFFLSKRVWKSRSISQ